MANRLEIKVQNQLLDLCSDLLLEARYPTVVSGKKIDRIIKTLQKIHKKGLTSHRAV